MKKLNANGIAAVDHELETAAQKIYKAIQEAYRVHLQQTNYDFFNPDTFVLHLEDFDEDRIDCIAKLPMDSDGSFTARLVFQFDSSLILSPTGTFTVEAMKYADDIVWRVSQLIDGYPRLSNRYHVVGLNGLKFLVKADFDFRFDESKLDSN